MVFQSFLKSSGQRMGKLLSATNFKVRGTLIELLFETRDQTVNFIYLYRKLWSPSSYLIHPLFFQSFPEISRILTDLEIYLLEQIF